MTFRWGIWGTGTVSAKFAMGLHTVAGAQVAWVLSRDEQRAKAFAGQVSADASFAEPAAAFAAGADAVYIATPPTTHADCAETALAAGLPVLVEKPFAASEHDAKRIATAARSADLFAMEAMWTRFHPAVQRARQLIQDGAIGTPRALCASFAIATKPGGSLYDSNAGGGALLHRGVYPLSLARYLLGPIVENQAMIRQHESEVDAETAVQLRHENGAISQCVAAIDVTQSNGLEIAGDKGTLKFIGPIYRPWGLRLQSVEARSSKASPGRFAALRETGWAQTAQRIVAGLRGPHGQKISASYTGNGYGHQASEVMSRIAAKEMESPIMPLDESVEIVGLMQRLLAEGLTS